MSDTISRAKAIDICRAPHMRNADYSDFEMAIMMLPPAQPAQPKIIRCKDCLMHGVCRFERGLGLDGYCSQAERRTDG